MDFNDNVKKALKQQQEIFEASYKTIIVAQGQVEQIATSILTQAQATEDGLKAFRETISEYGKSRDSIKKTLMLIMIAFKLFLNKIGNTFEYI